MNYELITQPRQLEAFCEHLAEAPSIAFDTEFVSEHAYRPQLCLIQVATPERLAVIDPLTVRELSCFWRVLVDGDHETVVHAAREELAFCLDRTAKGPKRLVDVQIGSGLIGLEYPANYSTLVSRLLGRKLHKGETRTDWRRRPLTQRQLEYALDDVRYLLGVRDRLKARLGELGRLGWLDDEMNAFQQMMTDAQVQERWWRVSGGSGLAPRSLAIVRELWRWRETEAELRNLPPRKVLRDDLIVELAKRQTADVKQIGVLRGMDRGALQRVMPELSQRIELALAIPEAECPRPPRREQTTKMTMVSQFLGAALSSICRAAEVAPSIVGTANDVRDLVAFRLGEGFHDEPPALARGWRAQVVGRVLDDLLTGRTAIRIRDPLSDDPLVFVPLHDDQAESPVALREELLHEPSVADVPPDEDIEQL